MHASGLYTRALFLLLTLAFTAATAGAEKRRRRKEAERRAKQQAAAQKAGSAGSGKGGGSDTKQGDAGSESDNLPEVQVEIAPEEAENGATGQFANDGSFLQVMMAKLAE